MTNKICVACDKEIEDRYTLVPVDRPYLNLFFHKEHAPKDTEEIRKYIEKMYKNKSFYSKKH